jgi:SNF2 family DNA or RNA helicase
MQLLPEQTEGVEWILKNLKKYKGVLLADGMGTGKTCQAIAVSKYALDTHEKPVLIVCPAYLIFNWLEELELWGIGREKICVIDSTKQILHEAPFYLTSYTMLTYDGPFKQLFKKSYSLIVLDEAHYCKSWSSQRSKKILGTFKQTKTTLKNKTKKFLLLTGTPMLNNIEELYNLIIRIAPGALKNMNRYTFIRTFAAHIEDTPWGIKHHGVKNAEALRSMLKNVMLRRTKIKGLPNKQEKDIMYNVKGAELKRLIKEENKFLLEHGIDLDTMEGDLKTATMDKSKLAAVRQRTAVLKLKLTLPAIKDIYEKTGKMVIYVYHREVQKKLSEMLEKEKIKHYIINGSIANKKRAAYIKDFQESADNTVILATISALKEGVNLTRGQAVLFIEHDWTPANIAQAVGRVWRRGQDNIVQVYHFLFNDGVDKYIRAMLKRKEKSIKKVIKG